jgi:uncharacterized protein (TIGR02265 family)
MSSKIQDPKSYWSALILGLKLPEEDTQNFLKVNKEVHPTHGIRAAIAINFSAVLTHSQPSALPDFEAYVRTLPKTPLFSFMPIMEFSACFLKAASLISPELPPKVAVNNLTITNARLLGDTPMMQSVVRASEGDLRTLLQQFVRNNQLVFNFGHRELDIDAQRRMRILYRDSYPLFSAYHLVGAAQGTCQYFHAHAEVSFEALDDTDFFIDIRW